MRELTYIIQDSEGIHARPAGLIVKKANEFVCEITLQKDESTANAKQIFAVMGLGIKKGAAIRVIANGQDEEKAIAEIEQILIENL